MPGLATYNKWRVLPEGGPPRSSETAHNRARRLTIKHRDLLALISHSPPVLCISVSTLRSRSTVTPPRGKRNPHGPALDDLSRCLGKAFCVTEFMRIQRRESSRGD